LLRQGCRQNIALVLKLLAGTQPFAVAITQFAYCVAALAVIAAAKIKAYSDLQSIAGGLSINRLLMFYAQT